MKKFIALLTMALIVPSIACATNSAAGQNGNGNSNNSSSVASTDEITADSTSSTVDASDSDDAAVAEEQDETNVEDQVKNSKPAYSPRNARATERMSAVATAVEQLVRSSNRVDNTGLGEQIREIARLQTKNQDKINESIDKAGTRTGFAKFFIGANFKELKAARDIMKENQAKIHELTVLMDQVESADEQLAISTQIVALQQENIDLLNQIDDADDGFSLFGWFSRWVNKY